MKPLLIFALSSLAFSAFAQIERKWTSVYEDKGTAVIYAKDGYVYARKCADSLESVTSLKGCQAKDELKVIPIEGLKKYLMDIRFDYVIRDSKFPEIEKHLNLKQKPEEIPLIKKDIEELTKLLNENPSNANLKMRLEIKRNNLNYAERSLKFLDYLSKQADKIVARISEGKEIVSNFENVKGFDDEVLYDLSFKIPFGNDMGGFPKEPPQCYLKYHSHDYWRGSVDSIMKGNEVLVEKCFSVVSPGDKNSDCANKVREVASKGLCKYDEPIIVPVVNDNGASINNSDRTTNKDHIDSDGSSNEPDIGITRQ